jgi:hypothetical protein
MQIIQSKPSSATLRQAALDDALGQIIGGMGAMDQQAKTKRAEALALQDQTRKLREAGYDVTEDQVAKSIQPEQSGFQKLLAGTPIGKSLGYDQVTEKVDLYGKRTPEWIAKNQRDESDKELDRQYKKAQIAKMNAEGGQGMGKQLSATEVAKFDEGNQIPMMLSDIKATLANNKDSFGPIAGRIAGLNPWDEKGQAIESQVSAAAQAFGRLMEGGVLKEQDVARYRKMFPNQSDTPETAANKLANVERLLSQRQNSTIGALKGSGYNVSAIDKGLSVPSAPDILNGGASSGSWGNQATANDEASMRNKLKTISREDKIRMLQGGR